MTQTSQPEYSQTLVRAKTHQVVRPVGDVLSYKKPLGDTDGIIQYTTDMTIKPFLNIHSALSPAPADIESTDLMKGLIAVTLMCLSSAPFLSFHEAHTMAANLGPTVSKKDIPEVYQWIQRER